MDAKNGKKSWQMNKRGVKEVVSKNNDDRCKQTDTHTFVRNQNKDEGGEYTCSHDF